MEFIIDEGQRRLAITKGDNNPVIDPEPVVLEGQVTRIVLILPYLGWLLGLQLQWFLVGMGALLGLMATILWVPQRKRRESG